MPGPLIKILLPDTFKPGLLINVPRPETFKPGNVIKVPNPETSAIFLFKEYCKYAFQLTITITGTIEREYELRTLCESP